MRKIPSQNEGVGHACLCERGGRRIGDGTPPIRRIQSQRHANGRGQEQGQRGQGQSHLQALTDELHDGHVVHDRRAQIQSQHVDEPAPVPDGRRLVKTELLFERRQRDGIGVGAQHQSGRVAGQHQQREKTDGHREPNREQKCQRAADDVWLHRWSKAPPSPGAETISGRCTPPSSR